MKGVYSRPLISPRWDRLLRFIPGGAVCVILSFQFRILRARTAEHTSPTRQRNKHNVLYSQCIYTNSTSRQMQREGFPPQEFAFRNMPQRRRVRSTDREGVEARVRGMPPARSRIPEYASAGRGPKDTRSAPAARVGRKMEENRTTRSTHGTKRPPQSEQKPRDPPRRLLEQL